jgi:NAD(P)-dependent dehydrogenase (short-subunit alcohol dehydrogenase family)
VSGDDARWGAVVLTGATSGIGAATARLLVARCDLLVVHGPESEDAVAGLLGELRAAGGADVRYVSADFSSLDAVVHAAREIREQAPRGIDLLINAAAVPGAPTRTLTRDGFERTLQVNALAPALLTRLLVPGLGDGARIVNVASSAHRVEGFHFDDIDLAHGYSPVAAYARSKLAMVTWSSLLSEEEAGTSTTVVALCPGLAETRLSAALASGIGGPPSRAAARVLHAAVADVPSGSYLENDAVVAPSAVVAVPRNREGLAALYWQRLAPFAAGARA